MIGKTESIPLLQRSGQDDGGNTIELSARHDAAGELQAHRQIHLHDTSLLDRSLDFFEVGEDGFAVCLEGGAGEESCLADQRKSKKTTRRNIRSASSR